MAVRALGSLLIRRLSPRAQAQAESLLEFVTQAAAAAGRRARYRAAVTDALAAGLVAILYLNTNTENSAAGKEEEEAGFLFKDGKVNWPVYVDLMNEAVEQVDETAKRPPFDRTGFAGWTDEHFRRMDLLRREVDWEMYIDQLNAHGGFISEHPDVSLHVIKQRHRELAVKYAERRCQADGELH